MAWSPNSMMRVNMSASRPAVASRSASEVASVGRSQFLRSAHLIRNIPSTNWCKATHSDTASFYNSFIARKFTDMNIFGARFHPDCRPLASAAGNL